MPDRGWGPFHRARLRYDPTFAAEVEYCYEKGLPHSFLLGMDLCWNQDDRDKLAAFMLERGQRCSMCGTATWEWEENPYAYEAIIEFCQGCMVKKAKEEDVDTPGSSVVLVTTAQAEKIRQEPKKIGPRRRKQTHAE